MSRDLLNDREASAGLVTAFRQAGNDRAIAVHALLLHAAILQCHQQSTAWFAVVFAVAEAAAADQVVELDKARFYISPAHVAQAKLANPRGVDQVAAARAQLAKIGLDSIDPATPVSQLGIGQQQMVEIARNLQDDTRILVLDEPTAMLTPRETYYLFEQIAHLTARLGHHLRVAPAGGTAPHCRPRGRAA